MSRDKPPKIMSIDEILDFAKIVEQILNELRVIVQRMETEAIPAIVERHRDKAIKAQIALASYVNLLKASVDSRMRLRATITVEQELEEVAKPKNPKRDTKRKTTVEKAMDEIRRPVNHLEKVASPPPPPYGLTDGQADSET